MVSTLGKFGSSQTSKVISQNWLTIIIKSVGKAAATFYLFFFFLSVHSPLAQYWTKLKGQLIKLKPRFRKPPDLILSGLF